MKSLFLLKTTLLVCAIQLVHGRCVCDPADTTCLNDCVNNARNCIEDCGNNTCFTECINVHWPGTTFEDDELEEAEEPKTSIRNEDDATTTPAATRTREAVATTTSTTEIDFIGALISAFFNPSNAQETTLPSPALKTDISDTASVLMPTSDAGPLLPLSEIASMLNITDPLLTTTHTTITSMVTVTPTDAPSFSSGTTASASSASFGSHLEANLCYPILILVLLTTVFIH
ncbi:beta-1,3-glucan linked protein [Mucor circinelloides]